MSKALRAARRDDINRSLRELRDKLASARMCAANTLTGNANDARETGTLELDRTTNYGRTLPYLMGTKHWETSATSSAYAPTVVKHDKGPLLISADSRFSQGPHLPVSDEGQLMLGETSRLSSACASTPAILPAPTSITPSTPTLVALPVPTPVIPSTPSPVTPLANALATPPAPPPSAPTSPAKQPGSHMPGTFLPAYDFMSSH